MPAWLIDTDVLVEVLRDSAEAHEFLASRKGELLVSAVTMTELFVGVRSDDEERSLDDFLAAFRWVDIDSAIAREAGRLKRRWGPSHGTGLADSLIAATAMMEAARLCTFNVEHFPMIEDLVVPYRR